MTTPMLKLRVLGPLDAEVDDRALAIGGPQQRRLLGVLVVNRGRVVSVDHLVDALWLDGDPPSGARRSVLTFVSRLRAALPDGALVTAGASYRLETDHAHFDIVEFDRLITLAEAALPDQVIGLVDDALALWRGEPFGEFAHEFWNEAETARLVERSVNAQEHRAAALLAIGHHARAVPELERLVRDQPLRERPVSLLMQALRSADRGAEGLRAFHRFRDHLAGETGLEPSADLVALCDSMYVDKPNDSQIIGRPLRGYTILEAIGEGSFGRVYSATQPGTGRHVAIKAIRPDLADSAAFVNRFDAEAQLIARLEHPHIVPLYDYWREPGGAYLVFRLLTGGTARDASIAQGAWSTARVSRLVEEIGGALLAAHSMGVVHNDVTSTNVLLDDAGSAYLSDFGIAIAHDPDPDGEHGESTTDAVIADVRSFGWLAWELLAGDRSPRPTRRSSATATRRGAPPSLIGVVESAPDGLDAILARATTGGYATVGEFILAWRAMVGRPDGALSPITSSDRRIASPARRIEAGRLALQAAAGINPYLGLRPFDEADSASFFGRTDTIEELVERIRGDRFVAVVGASGSGKSSVVCAGVLSRLRLERCAVVAFAPEDDPVQALAEALVEVSLRNERDLATMERIASIADRTRLLLFVDQFEECWTRASPTRRDEFVALLVAVIEADIDACVIVTIRADRFDEPLQHSLLGHLIGTATFVLSPMSPARLEEAVVLPAARAGVVFDEGVVADLVAEASRQPGALPLLQFTLRELYDRRVDGRIGVDQLVAVGGMAGAVGRRADDIYNAGDDHVRSVARELFTRLVTTDEHGGFIRRTLWQSELPAGAIGVASEFVDARLLVTDRDATTREPTIEIAHDALLTNWPRLASWAEEDRQWLVMRRMITTSSTAWHAGGEVDADLLRGSRLAGALEAVDDGRTVSDSERRFLDAGRAHRDAEIVTARRTTRRLRRLLAAVAAMLVVALVAGAVAVVQRGRANDASASAEAEAVRADAEAASAVAAAERADEQAADAQDSAAAAAASARQAAIEGVVGRSESLRSAQRDAAALLAVEAFRAADTPRTRSALFGTFTNGQGLLDTRRYESVDGFGQRGIVMPDGEAAYITDGPRIRPYDLDTGELGPPLEGETVGYGAGILRASPDGNLLARLAWPTEGDTPSVVLSVVDVTDGSLQFEPIELTAWPESATFSAGGTLLLVTLGADGRMVAIDSRTGDVVREVPGFPVDDEFPYAGGVAVLPDGRIAMSSAAGLVRLIDGTTFEVLDELQVARGVAFSLRTVADGASVVGSGQNGTVRIAVDPLRVVWEQTELAGTCWTLLVADARDALFCADGVGRLSERDLASGAPRRALDVQNGSTGSMWLAAGGTELVAFGSSEEVVTRWRLDGSGPITSVVAAGSNVRDISPDGDRLIVEVTESTAMSEDQITDFEYRAVDATTGETVAALTGMIAPLFSADGQIYGAVATPDGIRVAGYDEAKGTVIADGALLDELPTYFAGEQGKQFGIGSFVDGTRATLRRIPLSRPSTESFGPGLVIEGWVRTAISSAGDRIAVGTVDGIQLYDGTTFELLGEVANPLLQSAFITVSDDLYVISLGGELTKYDLETLQPIRTFGGSRGLFTDLLGTGDGSLIAVQGGDRTVTLYDAATGVQLGSPIAIAEVDFSIASLSLDGSRLAIGGGRESGVQVWELDPTIWVEAACRIAGRNLTRAEWNDNIGDLTDYRATCPEFPSEKPTNT